MRKYLKIPFYKDKKSDYQQRARACGLSHTSSFHNSIETDNSSFQFEHLIRAKADLSNAERPRQINSRYGIEVGVSKNFNFQDFLFVSTRHMNELSCEALILIPFP